MGKKKVEFSIMPNDEKWCNERKPGLVRHEVFGGPNRKISIKDGLVIFLKPEAHNMSDNGIHFNSVFDQYAKEKAQISWMKYYGKSEEDFRQRYGRSVLGGKLK